MMFDEYYGLEEAVLKLLKTMTRRLVPEKIVKGGEAYVQKVHGSGHDWLDYVLEHSPYKVGDKVAVAQSYEKVGLAPDTLIRSCGRWKKASETGGWKNKMFVRGEYMDHFVRITGVKVEKLRSISSEDCVKEGVIVRSSGDHCFYHVHGIERPFDFPRQAFAALIDKISGKGTWSKNPWVYAYTFEFVK